MNLISLIKVYGLNSLGINKIIQEKDSSKKRKSIIILISFLIAGLVLLGGSFAYSTIISKKFNDQSILLSMMMGGNCLVVFLTSIFLVKGIIFGFSDYDIQMSLPIDTKVIITSRLFILYGFNILLTAFFVIPSNIIYCINTTPSFEFYIMSFISFFLIPIIPMIVGVFVGLVVQFLLSKIKGGNIWSLLINVVLISVLAIFLMNSKGSPSEMLNQTEIIINTTSNIYPITSIYISAICEYNIVKFFLFIMLSISALAIFIYIIGFLFKKINTSLSTSKAKGNYKITTLKTSSVSMSLFKKELSRYFSSNLYVVNTTFGITVMLLITLVVLVMGEGKIISLLGTNKIDFFKQLAPLILATFVNLTAISCSSISLEGKNIWIIKTVPVKPITIFKSKIAVNLFMTIPVTILAALVFVSRLKFGIGTSILLFITPIVYAFFTGIFGVIINLLFPILNWTTEVVVIKQSIASVIAIFGGIVMVIIPIVLVFLVKSISSITIISISTIILGLICVILYELLDKKGSKLFEKLNF